MEFRTRILKSGSGAAALMKARVQALEEGTGEIVGDVDIYTSADCVTFADGLTLQTAREAGLLNGEQGLPGKDGADGKDGVAGPAGRDGISPLLTVGRVDIIPAGQAASVTDSGTPASPRLDFVIPADVTDKLTVHEGRQDNPHGVTKAQTGLGNVDNVQQAAKADFDSHNGDFIRHLTAAERAAWSDKYTRNEVDNKLSALETAIDWKESVAAYADIAAAYPNPEDGWTVNVRDTDYTYRYSGTEWIAISANAIPKATQSVDGLLSKEDKAALDDAYSRRHGHDNKSVLDGITASLVSGWNGAAVHISDAVKHITAGERTLWNTVSGKVDKETGKGLSANDYTAAEKTKLAGIEAGANHYVHPSHTARASGLYKITVDAAGHVSGAAAVAKGDITGLGIPAQDTVYTHPATHPASMITGLAKVAASGSYNDLSNKPAIPGIPPALPPSGAAGGDLSGTYPNPSVKDNSHAHTIANVTGLQTAMDGKAASSHSHTKAQITDFPSSLPANGGTAAYTNYINANNLAASTNLNNITTPGMYYCPANATVATFVNSPTSNALFLLVGKHAGIFQMAVEYMTSSQKVFIRNQYSGAWGAWQRIYTTANKPTASEIGAAAASHSHSAANITSGTLPAERGGTGQTSLQAARNAMGLGNTTGALPITNGGTGATTAAAALTALGAAPKASPALTGTPTAPTAPAAANNTQIATTAFVKAAVAAESAGGVLEAETTRFNADGSITQTYANRTLTTVFNADGSITETLVKGGVTIRRKTVFNADGSITAALI